MFSNKFSSKFSGNKDRLYIGHFMRGGAPKMLGGEDKYIFLMGFAFANTHSQYVFRRLTYERFHWAIMIGPKQEDATTRGWRFHAKENMTANPIEWEFTEEEVGMTQTLGLLTRTLIGKIKNIAVLEEILRGVPIRAGQVEGWNCVAWVHEALEMVEQNGTAMGTAVLDWTTVRDASMKYTQDKIDNHRFDGKATYAFDKELAATFNLLEGKEMIP